jgi:hypothetical protein
LPIFLLTNISVINQMIYLTPREVRKRPGIRYIDRSEAKGRIGALGAVLRGNAGIEAAGLYGEYL